MSRRADKKAADKKAASREYFDRHATRYEAGHRWRSVKVAQAKAIEFLQLQAEDRLLDIGCGTGAAVRAAAPIVSRAVGLDLSPQMIAEAKRRARGIVGAAFELGDSEHLPFAEAEFTAVLCTTSLHHYPHPELAIGEMARVLAPDGRVVIGDANRDHLAVRLLDRLAKRFQKSHAGILNSSELESLLRDAGLVSVGVRSLGHGYMLALGRRPGESKDG